MKKQVFSHEFHARVTAGGAIVLPPGVSQVVRPGELLRVRVGSVSSAGRAGGIVPDEVEVMQIALRQAESPDVIRACLATQGALRAAGGFGRSAGGRRGGKGS